MLVANKVIKVGKQNREPGTPVPEAYDWPPHVRELYVRQGHLVECDEEHAERLRERWFISMEEGLSRANEKKRMRLKRELEQTRYELKTRKRVAAEAEKRIAEIEAELSSTPDHQTRSPNPPSPEMKFEELIHCNRDQLDAIADECGLNLPVLSKKEMVGAILAVHNAKKAAEDAAELVESMSAKAKEETARKAEKTKNELASRFRELIDLSRPELLNLLGVDPQDEDVQKEYGEHKKSGLVSLVIDREAQQKTATEPASTSDASEGEDLPRDLKKLNKPDLTKEAEARSLPTDGTKADLLARVLEFEGYVLDDDGGWVYVLGDSDPDPDSDSDPDDKDDGGEPSTGGEGSETEGDDGDNESTTPENPTGDDGDPGDESGLEDSTETEIETEGEQE